MHQAQLLAAVGKRRAEDQCSTLLSGARGSLLLLAGMELDLCPWGLRLRKENTINKNSIRKRSGLRAWRLGSLGRAGSLAVTAGTYTPASGCTRRLPKAWVWNQPSSSSSQLRPSCAATPCPIKETVHLTWSSSSSVTKYIQPSPKAEAGFYCPP